MKKIGLAISVVVYTVVCFGAGYLVGLKNLQQTIWNVADERDALKRQIEQSAKYDYDCTVELSNLKQKSQKCESMLKIEQTVDELAAIPNQDEFGVTTSIENFDVYFTNQAGEKKLVAKSFRPNEDSVKYKSYSSADLSPNKKFILLTAGLWEGLSVEVYDILSGKLHVVAAGYVEKGKWLPDNRLSIGGDEKQVSIDGRAPWIIESENKFGLSR